MSAIENYAVSHSKPVHPVLEDLRQYTMSATTAPGMMVGPLEGKFLQLLVALTRAKTVLEVGTFTGYSTVCMADAIGDSGRIISLDVNANTSHVAHEFLSRANLEHRVRLIVGDARKVIHELNEEFDLVFVDADKTGYNDYYDLLFPKVRLGGFLVFDNMLWGGAVLNPQTAEDHSLALLNHRLRHDPRVDNFLLPLRDGIQIVQKLSE